MNTSFRNHFPAGWTTLALVLCTAMLASSCVRSSKHKIRTFHETEVNDTAALADYFGVLRPGARFFIDGHVSDSLFDPFDGFAFTADRPIHVEFRLFIDNPFADLDVCVYDPQLGITVDCFQSPNDPEVGAVDILAGGLDFHLVVESFDQDSSYSLEIRVYELFPNTAEDGNQALDPENGADAPGIVTRKAEGTDKKDASPDAFQRYFQRPVDAPETPVILEKRTLIEVDEDGNVRQATVFITDERD